MLGRFRRFSFRPTTAVLVTAALLALAALEVWALTRPFMAEWPVALPSGWSARESSILLDLILVLPAMTALLLWVWSQPLFVSSAPKLPRWLKPWVRPKRILYLLIPLALAQLAALEVGLGQLIAAGAGLFLIFEIVAFGALAVKVAQLSRTARRVRQEGYSLTTALVIATERTFGALPVVPVMRLAIFEVAQIYHLTLGWFTRQPAGVRTFTYHRHRDETVMIGLSIFVVIEAVPIHVVVHHHSTLAAWILTGLHVYSLLWTLGFLVSVRQRPHELSATKLCLSNGLFSEAVVELTNIREVTDARGSEGAATGDEVGESDPVAEFGSRHDVTLELHEPVTVYGPFGPREGVTTLRLGLDQPEEFLKALGVAR